MIEAVGERWWPEYFRALDERLAPAGRIGLQSILMGARPPDGDQVVMDMDP